MNDFEQTEPQAPAQPSMPWEAPQRWLAGFYPTFWWIIRYPSRAFSLPAAGGPMRPALFVAAMALHLEIISQLLAWALSPSVGLAQLPMVLLMAVMNGVVQAVGAAMLATPVLSGLTHLALRAMSRAHAPFWASYRAMAYTSVTSSSVLVVMIGWHIGRLVWGAEADDMLIQAVFGGLATSLVWSLYVGCVALNEAHHCGRFTAAGAQVAAVLTMVIFMIGVLGGV